MPQKEYSARKMREFADTYSDRKEEVERKEIERTLDTCFRFIKMKAQRGEYEAKVPMRPTEISSVLKELERLGYQMTVNDGEQSDFHLVTIQW